MRLPEHHQPEHSNPPKSSTAKNNSTTSTNTTGNAITSPTKSTTRGGTSVPSFFSPPIQRQKWGDLQVRPHVNWGDLFFDLFYVAAAYNLAQLIKTDPTSKGIFYFLSLFGPVFSSFWQAKMIHDSRFEMPDDVIHRFLEVMQLGALATSVLHIRPVEYMSHGADHPETFLYCVGLVSGSLIHILLLCEIKFLWVVGQENVARRAAGRDLRHYMFSFILQCAAMMYSGLLYYGKIGGTLGEEYHGPIIILLMNWITKPIAMYMVYVVSFRGDFKSKSVPMNIDFAIHRYGEWTMLMLGECILSLLIVNDISRKNEAEYYFTFYLGIVSVTLLQYLYFKSQPHDADHHALRRTKTSGFVFTVWLQIYSAALIVVGVSYKMLLTEYTSKYSKDVVYESEGGNSYSRRSRVLAVQSENSAALYDSSTRQRRQRIANLYCFGLAVVFLSLDMMNVAHSGLRTSSTRCHNPENGKWRIKAMTMVVFTRVGILAFIVTLSQYVTDPEYVAFIGFGTIVMQVMVRFLGSVYFPFNSVLDEIEQEEFHPEYIEEEKGSTWENSPRL